MKLDAEADAGPAQQYGASWTPCVLILDAGGRSHYRSDGFLPPDEFAPMALGGKAALVLHRYRYDEAAAMYDALLTRYPDSRFRPELLYYLGAASLYAGDRDATRRAWRELRSRFPDSVWALRLPS